MAGRSMETSEEQPTKAPTPMETRLRGKATETREMRPRNALSGTCVIHASGSTACPSVTTTCQPPTFNVLGQGVGVGVERRGGHHRAL